LIVRVSLLGGFERSDRAGACRTELTELNHQFGLLIVAESRRRPPGLCQREQCPKASTNSGTFVDMMSIT